MTPYEIGDIILVPFPFSNQSGLKKRPAVVISSKSYNLISLDLVIIAVTSQISLNLGIGESSIYDWRQAGLLKESMIKPAIATIEQNLIIKKLGKLSVADKFSFKNSLNVIFDL